MPPPGPFCQSLVIRELLLIVLRVIVNPPRTYNPPPAVM